MGNYRADHRKEEGQCFCATLAGALNIKLKARDLSGKQDVLRKGTFVIFRLKFPLFHPPATIFRDIVELILLNIEYIVSQCLSF